MSPLRAVPTQDQCSPRLALITSIAHRPSYAGCGGGDAAEIVNIVTGIGAGHDAPLGTIPTLQQRLPAAHGAARHPYILRPRGGDTIEVGLLGASGVGAGYLTP